MPAVRVRFAPSPTGQLHIGGARTALFNYLFARNQGGTFVLRIDDTDLLRSKEEHTAELLSALKWLGLQWDEGPYFQTRRAALYQKEAFRLLKEGKAYHCYCSTEELEAGRKKARAEGRAYLYPGHCRHLSEAKKQAFINEGRKPVVRITTPDKGRTVVQDLVRGEVCFENSDLDDFIIVKANGLPAYNFASVLDDLDLEISHVIRAEEHLPNTPRQIVIARALGDRLPCFAHVPMILAPDRSKLSKRHGATSVEEFRDLGYLPEALVNYMALLGWSPGENREFFSLKEAALLFELEKVNKTAAIYDTAKLTWMNSQYIMQMEAEQLTALARPWFAKAKLTVEPLSKEELDYLQQVIQALRTRARTLKELAEAADYFYRSDFNYDEKAVKKAFKKEGAEEVLELLTNELKNLEPYEPQAVEKLFQRLGEKHQLSAGRLIQPARVALTGRLGGPELKVIICLLGQKESVLRLKRAQAFVEKELKA